MDDLFEKYTAAEFLKWLQDEIAEDYIDNIVEEDNFGARAIEVFNIELLKDNFIRSVKRYQTVKRGHIIYIHDNERCEDIMQFRFNSENYEEVQNEANNFVESLNSRNVSFIARRHNCF